MRLSEWAGILAGFACGGGEARERFARQGLVGGGLP